MAATVSTYCLVASWKLVVGSCVTVTVVRPPKVKAVAPSATFVVPRVRLLLVKPAFGMVATAVKADVPLPTR